MKKRILFIAIMFFTYKHAIVQIISIEYFYALSENGQDVPDGVTDVKDINNKLDKFTGTWIGTENSIKYEVKIEEVIKTYKIADLKVDALNLRYKVTSPSGQILASTLDLASGHEDVLGSKVFEDEYNLYTYIYYGSQSACGQNGFIQIGYLADDDILTFIRMSDSYKYIPSLCPNGEMTQVLPESHIYLTKASSGWIETAYVTTNPNGLRDYIGNVNGAWEDKSAELNKLTITPGEKLNISLTINPGHANEKVRLYIEELDANNKHLSWNIFYSGETKAGEQTFEYTVKDGYNAILHINKPNPNEDIYGDSDYSEGTDANPYNN